MAWKKQNEKREVTRSNGPRLERERNEFQSEDNANEKTSSFWNATITNSAT